MNLYSEKWTNEIEAKIEALLGNGPEPQIDYAAFKPF